MIPVNITAQFELTEKRRSIHGSILFAKPATQDDAAQVLADNVNHATVPDGFKRTLFQLAPHSGNQHFEFFITDTLVPPPEPPPEPPKEEASQ